jgi:hypothetical protein
MRAVLADEVWSGAEQDAQAKLGRFMTQRINPQEVQSFT